AVVAVVCFTLSAPRALAQTNADLKREIESLKTGQKAIQKDLQSIKDILTGKQPPMENVFISTDGAPAVGEKTAKVTLVEFSDYQCPFCGRYFNQTLSQVMDQYVKTGKVHYIFRDFPLESIHPLALKAAEAAHCAGDQGKYWEMHDRLYKNQQNLAANELAGHATALSLDMPKFQQCLDSGKYTALVRQNEADGQKVGVRGTPAFFLGSPDPKDAKRMKAVSMLSGAQPFTAFKDAIDKLLNPPKEEEKGKDKGSQ
ncbi:MAG TPA: DsbA family protein, partial [Alphaproteobacteria bacterium]|nr:DsbA family protein [Alphaproteobacteria bacterium]